MYYAKLSCLRTDGYEWHCIHGTQGTAGDYKDPSGNNEVLHANHGEPIMFVKLFDLPRYDTFMRSSIQRHRLKGGTCLQTIVNIDQGGICGFHGQGQHNEYDAVSRLTE